MNVITWYILGLAGATLFLLLEDLFDGPEDLPIIAILAVLGPLIAAMALLDALFTLWESAPSTKGARPRFPPFI